ncbi:transposase [Saccharopolyspora pogona]|uniref:transposase n=1 Tax=Saccharopolyspora pogona TaxID=333966 RepID=UPI0016882388|nr:transposase [Saccharopolyspora pogona]
MIAATPLILRATQLLASQVPSAADQLRLIDATPVLCGSSLETVKRSELAGWAGYGYCASHSRFYWGLKLYLVTTLDGMPLVWCFADPKIGEREVAAELPGHAHDLAALPAGVVVIGDKGFAGKAFQRDMTELDITCLRPDRRDEEPPSRQPGAHPATHRVDHQHDQGATVLGEARRTHTRRRHGPYRPAHPRPGRRHLAQLTGR